MLAVASALALQLVEKPGHAALASSSGIAMQRAGTGDFVEQAACLAIFGLRNGGIAIVDGLEEGLGLFLDASLAPEVERVTLRVLTDTLLGGQ